MIVSFFGCKIGSKLLMENNPGNYSLSENEKIVFRLKWHGYSPLLCIKQRYLIQHNWTKWTHSVKLLGLVVTCNTFRSLHMDKKCGFSVESSDFVFFFPLFFFSVNLSMLRDFSFFCICSYFLAKCNLKCRDAHCAKCTGEICKQMDGGCFWCQQAQIHATAISGLFPHEQTSSK